MPLIGSEITRSVPRPLIGPPPLRWLPLPSPDMFRIGRVPEWTRWIGDILDWMRSGLDALRIVCVPDRTRSGLVVFQTGHVTDRLCSRSDAFRIGCFSDRALSGSVVFQIGRVPDRLCSRSDTFRIGCFPDQTHSGLVVFQIARVSYWTRSLSD